VPRVEDLPGPYWFYFYSFDCYEPRHVHVRRDRRSCKFWLEPIGLERNCGFAERELTGIRSLIETHYDRIIEAWHEHCG
jgi:hypothetical protein